MNSRRRRDIRVAIALLAYVGGIQARVSLLGVGPVKRLVRLCERENLGDLPIPALMLRHPALLRLMEPRIASGDDFSRALIAATWVYEMTSLGLPRFRMDAVRGPLRAMLSIGATLAMEALLLPLRMLLARMARGRRQPSGRSDPRLP